MQLKIITCSPQQYNQRSLWERDLERLLKGVDDAYEPMNAALLVYSVLPTGSYNPTIHSTSDNTLCRYYCLGVSNKDKIPGHCYLFFGRTTLIQELDQMCDWVINSPMQRVTIASDA